MSSLFLNQFTFALFALAMLWMGWQASKKSDTMREYALAGRSLGGGMLIMTLLATMIESAQTTGMWSAPSFGMVVSLLPTAALCINAVLLGYFVLPSFANFNHHYTIGDVMYTLYGSLARYITVAFSTVTTFFMVISQLLLASKLGDFLNLSPQMMIILGGLLLVTYTAVGGIRAVSTTDVLQFLCIAIGSLSLLFFVLQRIGGLSPLVKVITASPIAWHSARVRWFFYNAFFWSTWPTAFMMPPVVQRMLMTRNKKHIRSMFFSFGTFYATFRVVLALLGFSMLLLKHGSEDTPRHMGKIIHLLTNNTWVQMLFFIALFSILLSTADSFLNSLAILWANDVFLLGKSEERRAPSYTRWVTIGFGVCFTLAALLFRSVYLTEISMYGFMCFSGIVLPLIAGVLGLKGSKKIFTTTLLVFAFTFIISMVYLSIYQDWMIAKFVSSPTSPKWPLRQYMARISWLVAIVGSSIAFFIAHYIENGGAFVFVKRSSGMWEESGRYTLSKPTLKWFYNLYSKGNSSYAHSWEPHRFGLFIYLTYMIPLFGSYAGDSILWIAGLRGVGILLITLLLLESIWPKKWLRFFHTYYLFTLFYCLPFVHTLTLLLHAGSFSSLLMFILSTVLLVILLDYKRFFLFQTGGMLAAWGTARFFLPFTISNNHPYFTFLALFYIAVIVLLFARKKQVINIRCMGALFSDHAYETSQVATYRETSRQLALSIDAKSDIMDAMQKSLSSLRQEKSEAKRTEYIDRIQDALRHLQQVASKSREYLPILPQRITLHDLLQSAFYALKMRGMDPSTKVLLDNQTRLSHIVWDAEYIKRLLVAGIQDLHKHHPERPIQLFIDDTLLKSGINFVSSHAVVPALSITLTVNQAQVGKSIYTLPDQIEPIDPSAPLADNLRIVDAHYGYASITDDRKTQTYVLPVDTTQVRPNIEGFAAEGVQTIQLDAPEDKAFLEKVKAKGIEIDTIQKALKIAKHYHAGQVRKTGEPFYHHPLTVASLLLGYTDKTEMIVAALLHDSVEDTHLTLDALSAIFGKETTYLVDEVTHLHQLTGRKVRLNQHENLLEIFTKMDPDVLLIKLLDRLHNMRTLEGHTDKGKREDIAHQTLSLFVPIARMLKQQGIAAELAGLAGKVL